MSFIIELFTKQNEYIKKAKKAVSDKDYDFDFVNNKKYHYIAVTKPNILLEKFIICDGDKFCFNCFSNFQNEVLIKKQKVLWK